MNTDEKNGEIPVYVFFGFMDSGKTTLAKETIFDNGFTDDFDRCLFISCEDGDVEMDPDELDKIGVDYVEIDDKDDFTLEKLQSLQDQYDPEAVFIEYNGTWESSLLYEMDGPADWVIVQSICTVDATTFEMYLKNMGTMIKEQMFRADVIIFNRCDDATPKAKFRANVKGLNRRAQIVYERKDGSIDNRPDELPFDINADELHITDADYALWFMDCMDNPKKYNGKTVDFLGLVYNPKEGKGKLHKGTFVAGRFAMTCCVQDIQYLGMPVRYDNAADIEHKSWIHLTAKVKNEFAREYRGKGPVLYPVSIEEAERPASQEEELVYFN
ncbi:MAG: GTP-binding protein [Lachnospiraceae bacterium]|nr:GTP-binding protein [Lachnospiraceae bacterium]